jgi:hypothetical protein
MKEDAVYQKKVSSKLFDKLYEMLNEITIPIVKENNRHNFPRHRGGIFGLIRGRYKSGIGLSALSKQYPEIYKEIVKIGKEICPFHFTTIQINHNLVSTPHIDKNNVGEGLLVSFGDYEGGNIMIGGEEYDTKYRPTIFNGSKLEHYNTKFKGEHNKYSLIYFNINYAVKKGGSLYPMGA